jgi:hypothetical protein
MKVNNYIDSTFIFVDMFFVKDGIVLLFYSNDLWVFKEVQSFLDNYSFTIWMKWAIINYLPLYTLLENLILRDCTFPPKSIFSEMGFMSFHYILIIKDWFGGVIQFNLRV